MVLLIVNSGSDYGPAVRTVSIVMIVLASTAVLLRFWARRLAGQSITWDDWLMLMALPCSWALDIGMILAVNLGHLGQHIITATPSTIVVFLKMIYASQFCYPAAITFIKFSIVAFYRRLFWPYMTKPRMYVLNASIAIWLIVSVLTKIFACTPINGYWHRDTVHPPHCINETHMFVGLTIPNIAIDVVLVVFPLPPVWNLQVLPKQKMELTSMFAAAGLVLVFSSIRLVAIVQAGQTQDVTWAAVPAAIFEVLEISAAIIFASIPSMLPLFRVIVGSRRKPAREESLGVASEAFPERQPYLSWIRRVFRTNSLLRLDSEEVTETGAQRAVVDPEESGTVRSNQGAV